MRSLLLLETSILIFMFAYILQHILQILMWFGNYYVKCSVDGIIHKCPNMTLVRLKKVNMSI